MSTSKGDLNWIANLGHRRRRHTQPLRAWQRPQRTLPMTVPCCLDAVLEGKAVLLGMKASLDDAGVVEQALRCGKRQGRRSTPLSAPC